MLLRPSCYGYHLVLDVIPACLLAVACYALTETAVVLSWEWILFMQFLLFYWVGRSIEDPL